MSTIQELGAFLSREKSAAGGEAPNSDRLPAATNGVPVRAGA
jgi:hypothetical protein